MILYHRKLLIQQKMYKFIDLIQTLFDFILPKDPDISDIENMSEDYIQENIPIANDIKNSNYRAVFQYKNKIVRKAIWAIKYNKNKKIINKFSKIMYELILDDISDELLFSTFNNPLLVPIPMHKNDMKKRGYNQSELIVREINSVDENKNFDVSFLALEKIKETPHQSGLKNKQDRIKNLKNCFVADTNIVRDRNIILIDDVITTGTTMNEAKKVLKVAGAKKVIGFSLAH